MEKELYLLFELLRNDGSIVINKKLAKGIGLHQAIMYSELISKYLYFSKRGELKEGYFFNTVENMEQDTCLSDYQQRESISKLKDLGLNFNFYPEYHRWVDPEDEKKKPNKYEKNKKVSERERKDIDG